MREKQREEKASSEKRGRNITVSYYNRKLKSSLEVKDPRSITLGATDKSFFFFFSLRKISPELTSAANPPLFAEEDWT